MSKRKRFSARRSAALYGVVHEASVRMRIEMLRGRLPIFTNHVIDWNKLVEQRITILSRIKPRLTLPSPRT